MKVGVTGTRDGLTGPQSVSLTRIVLHLRDHVDEFHHGDCIGADAQAAALVEGMTVWRHVAHPADTHTQRAYRTAHEYRAVKRPLVRNQDIVRESDIVIAMPRQLAEQRRGSGTWATMRHAAKVGRPLVVIWPDGSVWGERLTPEQRGYLTGIVERCT